MTTKIGLIGDIHASPEPLQQALEIFSDAGVDEILCTGDIAGYYPQLKPCIDLLKKYHCHSVIGNHDQSYIQDPEQNPQTEEFLFLQALPESLQFTIEQQRIYLVHAEPPAAQHGGIKLLDRNGQLVSQQQALWSAKLNPEHYEILIVGHTHQVYALALGDVFVINPGSSQFNHSCMILTLPELEVQSFALSSKQILKCWNFSHLFAEPGDYPRLA